MTQADDAPPVSRFISVFGSWNWAKEAAGLETFRKDGRGEPSSDEELLELFCQLDAELEHPVTFRDMQDADGYPSAVTYQRRFGSWNNAKELAGLETIVMDDTRPQYSDAELLNMLRSLAADLDRPLRIRDVDEAADLPGHATFERRFGSWNRAKEQAGLETVGKGKGSRGPSYTDDELLDLLRQRATEVKGKLTKKAMDAASGYPGSSTYERRIGSWTEAKRQAGLDD